MKYLRELKNKDLTGKICLLRIDLNIEDGFDRDAFRVNAILPTIEFLLKRHAKILLLSHRGRPNNHEHTKKQSLKPFLPVLSKKFGEPVIFLNNLGNARNQLKTSKKQLFLLENLRFLPGEVKNDLKLAQKLAILGDFYVNEAFPASHRESASISAITRFLPSYAGLRLETEIEHLWQIMDHYKRPLTVILGGAKISDKIGILKYFWNRADYFLLAGGPANTCLAASNLPVGDSLFDEESVGFVKQYLNLPKLKLPIDLKISDKKILDIGPHTIQEYSDIIRRSKTIIWNGPVGFYEKKEFSNGTKGIWQAILKNKRLSGVVGGGETITSLNLISKKPKLPLNLFLSTGGGAMLEFLSGKKLPGIEALK